MNKRFTQRDITNPEGIELKAKLRTNPEGIESLSPGLADSERPTLGRFLQISNPEGVASTISHIALADFKPNVVRSVKGQP